MTDESVETAQRAATAARQRLFATVGEVQFRLEPSHLLEEAVADVRGRSEKMALAAGDTVREHPAAMAAAAAMGALLVVHRPLLRFGRRLFARTRKPTTMPQVDAPDALERTFS